MRLMFIPKKKKNIKSGTYKSSFEKMKKVISIQELEHVAKIEKMEAFGGSLKPANIVFAFTKVRRELADDSSITISDVNCVRMSPLIVVGDGLVQIAMIKQAWMNHQTLWVPEAARGSLLVAGSSGEVGLGLGRLWTFCRVEDPSPPG